jgi:RNA recognition motif-containing protein
MRSQDSRNSSRRSGRGSRRSSQPRGESRSAKPAAPKTFWEKLKSFFSGRAKSVTTKVPRANGSAARPARKVEQAEVTSPKLYVGNLSFDATESDLVELFNGVGSVRNAEIVTHRQTEKSKGFGFVTMTSVDEAQRAVQELHEKDFLGRKLVVNGAKSGDHEPNYRG